jgi:hypothetical protein
LIVFHIEKVSKDWSFSSVIRTSPLSYSCFFFPLVEVGLVKLVVPLAALLVVEGIKEGGGEEDKVEEGGAKVEAERPFFSFSAYVFGATSLRRALTSSTSPFRTSLSFLSFSLVKGLSPARTLYT